MTRVVLHIERLVLRGVPAGEREALVRALTNELQRRFGQAELLSSLRQGPTDIPLQRERFAVPGAGGEQLGRAAAAQIAGGAP